MNTSKLLAGLLALAATGSSLASATLLSEGFDDIATLGAQGWSQQNFSAPVGASGWFQGNAGVFGSALGAANSYIGANYLNGVAFAGGTISNWLMTPTMALASSVDMSFELRLLGESFLDTVEVYVSVNGASTNIADFVRVATYSSTSDTGWLTKSVDLSSVSGITNGRVAFRYVATDTNSEANYVGIDSVLAVPEPTSLALASLALLGVVATRRKAQI